MPKIWKQKVFIEIPKRKLKIYNAFDEMPQWTGNMYYAWMNDGSCLDT